MTAEEMFNELGYEKHYQKIGNCLYKYYGKNDGKCDIKFINKNKIIINENLSDEWDSFTLSVDLLKAINKQIEELGWK